MMIFRKAAPDDLPGILRVIEEGRHFIAAQGIDQWQDGYPDATQIENDINSGHSYLYENDGLIVATALFTPEPSPEYLQIDGAWHTDSPYLTIHRMALADSVRHSGLAFRMLEQAIMIARQSNLLSIRIDTHRGNLAMRRFLGKIGFSECGFVYYCCHDGDPIRVAYDLLL